LGFFGRPTVRDIQHHPLPGNRAPIVVDRDTFIQDPDVAAIHSAMAILPPKQFCRLPMSRVRGGHALAILGMDQIEPMAAVGRCLLRRLTSEVLDIWAEVERRLLLIVG
jgi:hypothetical protein